MIARRGVERGKLGGVARMQRMKSGVLIALAFDITPAMARAADSARPALGDVAQDLHWRTASPATYALRRKRKRRRVPA